MTPEEADLQKRVQRILLRPVAERESALEAESGGDPALRAALERAVLEADRATDRDTTRVDSSMPPPSTSASRLAPPLEETLVPGEEIVDGSIRYVLVKRLPGGGLGEVWVADQVSPIRRRVAIKFIRPDKFTKANEARFDNERRVLASFDHPNIARFYDAGRHRDRPWFAMEYIEGLPIDVHCERNGLGVEERIRLVQQVARAVQYAHDREIVHRDIKPGNVLVTAEGAPKLLDFGIAKLIGTRIEGRRDITTDFEPHTEEYASPEQLRSQPSTVRSDVYALGVMLYELLTEQLPYHVKTRVRERIREIKLKEPPPAMSEALEAVTDGEPAPAAGSATDGTGAAAGTAGTAGSGVGTAAGSRSRRNRSKRLAEIARRRNTKPERLIRSLRGDLDNIVAKAMRIEPLRRYASPESLASDLENHLQGLPVEARPESAAARLSRVLVRNRWIVAGVLVALVALTGVLAASFLTVQNRYLQSERNRLTAQREVFRRGLDDLARLDEEIAISASRDSGQTERLRSSLERLESQAAALGGLAAGDREGIDDLLWLAELRLRLARVAFSPGNRQNNEGRPEESLRWLEASEKALGEARAIAEPLGVPLPKSSRIEGSIRRERADRSFHLDADVDAARATYLSARESFERGISEAVPSDPIADQLRRDRIMVMTKLVDLVEHGLPRDAEPAPDTLEKLRSGRREVVDAYRREVVRDPSARSRVDLSVGLQRLGFALTAGPGAEARLDEAISLYSEAVDIIRPELGAQASAETRRYAANAMLYLASALRIRMDGLFAAAAADPDAPAAAAATAAAQKDLAWISDLVEEASGHLVLLAFRAPEEELARENLLRIQQGFLPGLPIHRSFAILDAIRNARLVPDGLVQGKLATITSPDTLRYVQSPVTQAIFIGNGTRMAYEWRSRWQENRQDPEVELPPERLTALISDAFRDAISLARSAGGTWSVDQGDPPDSAEIRLRIEVILCLALAAQPFADELLGREAGESEALLAECRRLRSEFGEPTHPIMAGEAGQAWHIAKIELGEAERSRSASR